MHSNGYDPYGLANIWSGCAQASMYSQAQQQSAYAQYQAQQAQMSYHTQPAMPPVTPYMIDGVRMTWEQFINTLYPEDCPEKTMLILRLNKGNDK